MSTTDYDSLANFAGLFGIEAKDSNPTRLSMKASHSLLMPTPSIPSTSSAANNKSEQFGH